MDRLRRVFSRPGNKRTDQIGAPASDWRKTFRHRLIITASLLAVWAVGIEVRLVYLQVFDHAELVERAERQQMRTIKPPAKRGDIVDRRGHVLATSVDADTIYAVPSAIGDERAVIGKLCGAFGDCTARERQDLLERLTKQRNFAYIRRQVAPDVAERVKALNLEGIGSLKESRRYYPKTELAAHLVGFVGLDNKGLGGIESAYDSQIRGKDGQILVQTDARRHAFNRFEKPPTAGATIELTIDEYLQHIAEKELHAGVIENRAASGSVVIMNPHTGEILAMANEPTFDPNTYREATLSERRNRAVQDIYEPGSTFKLVTASAAIEEKVLPLDVLIDTNPGTIRIGSRVVTEASHHNYGAINLMDVIVHSSNVGAIKIGFKLGTDRLSDYVQRFGFGRPVSPDFPSESPGIVWDRAKWTDSALASVSMGYQVGVTPLQMASAVSSVANRGEYVEPRVVRAVYRGDRRYEVTPKVLRRTVTPETAAAVTAIMEQVVERGTGKGLAQIPGYSVAGKTGTANTLVNGRYTNDTYASFAGFLPSNNPAVTILVMLNSPHGPNGHFGGPVSAPIFRRIAEATLRYMGIPPSINPEPPVLVARDGGAALVSTSAPMVEDGPSMSTPDVPGTVPDVRGMTARDAARKLVNVGMLARLSGDGFVVSQEPAPGEPIAEGSECRLTLARAGGRQASVAVQP
jgi:cell division protein FtsI (penicillin-binding protein 3)